MRSVFVALFLLIVLAGCATAPSQITNACAIFEQRNGMFNNWRKDAEAAQREFGVPVPVMMATIYNRASSPTPARRAPSFSASFRGSANPPLTAMPRRWTARGIATAAKPGAGAPAAPTLPTPSISSAGITPPATARTALR